MRQAKREEREMPNRPNGNADIEAWREVRQWERRFSIAIANLAGTKKED